MARSHSVNFARGPSWSLVRAVSTLTRYQRTWWSMSDGASRHTGNYLVALRGICVSHDRNERRGIYSISDFRLNDRRAM